MTACRRTFILTLMIWHLSAPAVLAQPSLEEERASLRGVTAFRLVVDVETRLGLSGQEALDMPRLQQGLADRLQEAGLPVQDPMDRRAEGLPYLYVHVNALDAGQGLVPFGIRIAFYQEVRLARRPASPATASTWETGLVGLVSSDQLPVIPESALALLEEFIDAYQRVNP